MEGAIEFFHYIHNSMLTVKPLISWPNIKVYILGSRQKQEMDFTKTKTCDLQISKAIRAAGG